MNRELMDNKTRESMESDMRGWQRDAEAYARNVRRLLGLGNSTDRWASEDEQRAQDLTNNQRLH
jgi:hypothetical protein